MNIKKNLSALLAAGMLAGMLPAAGAAASPVVEYDMAGQFADLTITGLPADRQIHSVQLELTVDGLHEIEFTPVSLPEGSAPRISLGKVVRGENETNDTAVTIYVDSIVSIVDDQQISLGTLKFANAEVEHTFDSSGKIILLNEHQNRISEGPVSVRKAGSTEPEKPEENPGGSTGGNNSSGSSSGSSRPTSSGSSGKLHEVSTSQSGNGSVRVSPSDAEKGDTVTVTAKPDAGYKLQSIAVLDSRGREIDLTERGDGTFSFIMPDGKVTVEAVFVPDTNSAAQTAPMSFADVPAHEWYYSAVSYVYQHGMMSGTSAAAFSPNVPTNRAMIVSILHRLEGSPAAGGGTFPDVAAGQYYTGAVAWAASNGIVSGYSNGQFRPDDIITREQLASILYRYAQYKGYALAAPAALSGFSDAADVSQYAVEPMGWAVAQGLISGTNRGTLDPAGGATRAQAASILMRFCQTLANMP